MHYVNFIILKLDSEYNLDVKAANFDGQKIIFDENYPDPVCDDALVRVDLA